MKKLRSRSKSPSKKGLGNLLERGLARSMIWKDGELPEGAPPFASSLSYDLLSYGYSLLSLGIRLKELGGNEQLCKAVFKKSAESISNVINNGSLSDVDRPFHKLIAASSYHIGQYSAKAFSLLRDDLVQDDIGKMQLALSLFILRQFDELEELIIEWKNSESANDSVLASRFEEDLESSFGNKVDGENIHGITEAEFFVLQTAIIDNYLSALYEFLFALETGEHSLISNVIEQLQIILEACGKHELILYWWIVRVTKHLVNECWEHSLHKVVPFSAVDDTWKEMRWIFILSLLKRKKAEIDLWPSQLEGAQRVINDQDNLVVSLPTSAGETRVAELCILRCLACEKRVLFITPSCFIRSDRIFFARDIFSFREVSFFFVWKHWYKWFR